MTRPVVRFADPERLHFWCPGCDMAHGISYAPGGWAWNGDVMRPTFRPSLLTRGGRSPGGEKLVCHGFVTDGQIQFLTDSTHALAGQTVPLPPWPYA